MSATTELKPPQSHLKGRVERADSFLGLISKLVTIVAALSTVGFWLFSTFYVGTLELKTNVPVNAVTLRLYNDRGEERVFHTDLAKVTPGRYRVVVDTYQRRSGQYSTDVKFNQVTVLNHRIDSNSDQAATPAGDGEKSNRKWWQFWRRK